MTARSPRLPRSIRHDADLDGITLHLPDQVRLGRTVRGGAVLAMLIGAGASLVGLCGPEILGLPLPVSFALAAGAGLVGVTGLATWYLVPEDLGATVTPVRVDRRGLSWRGRRLPWPAEDAILVAPYPHVDRPSVWALRLGHGDDLTWLAPGLSRRDLRQLRRWLVATRARLEPDRRLGAEEQAALDALDGLRGRSREGGPVTE